MTVFRFLSCVCLFVAVGCVTSSTDSDDRSPGDALDESKWDQGGSSAPSLFRAGNRYGGATGDYYIDHVQPVIARRCVVCHSCTNGPCQLSAVSHAALERGILQTDPYDFGAFDQRPTRTNDDYTTTEWREQGFESIMPTSAEDAVGSILYRSLVYGLANVPVESDPQTAFTIDAIRTMALAQQAGNLECPAESSDYDDFIFENPIGGMPWGLSTIPSDELNILLQWAQSGAPGPSAYALARIQQPEISARSRVSPSNIVGMWEAFLNQGDIRAQLVARYIYEHSFLANIHLEESPGEFYRIVRSSTQPGQAIEQIITDLPMDAPGVSHVYYRLEKNEQIIPAKSHVVWEVGLDTLSRLRELFLDSDWDLDQLPGYESTNPFEYFQAIPAEARARFMLENSRLIVQSVARGPICMVQSATYAVPEYFWFWFLDPESDPSVQNPQLGLDSWAYFYGKDEGLATRAWLGPKAGEPYYREAFESELRTMHPNGLGIDDIWDGDGENPNAWLTLNRHQNSTEISHGGLWPIHARPRAVWLLSYANFERIYYNDAARYRYWGSLLFQVSTFDHQQYTRTEAEDLYASLYSNLTLREELRDRFTSLAGRTYQSLGEDYAAGRGAEMPTHWDEDDLMRAVFERFGAGVTGEPDPLNRFPYDDLPIDVARQIVDTDTFEAGLRTLTGYAARFAQYVPNILVVRLDGQHVYTILANRGYRPDKIAGGELLAREQSEDSLIAVPGLFGAHPHLFVDLSWSEADDFLYDLAAVESESDWHAFYLRYAIPRNSAEVWSFLDWLHEYQAARFPTEAAILDMASYDRDAIPY